MLWCKCLPFPLCSSCISLSLLEFTVSAPPPPSCWLVILDRISSGSPANALSEGSLCWRHFWNDFFSAKRSQGCRFWRQLLIFLTPFSQTLRQVCVCARLHSVLWLVLSPGRHESAWCLYSDSLKVKWSEIWYFYVSTNCPPRAVPFQEVSSPVLSTNPSTSHPLARSPCCFHKWWCCHVHVLTFFFAFLSAQSFISAPPSDLDVLRASSLSSFESCLDDALPGFWFCYDVVLWGKKYSTKCYYWGSVADLLDLKLPH